LDEMTSKSQAEILGEEILQKADGELFFIEID
jgi:hypothetical protein